MDNIRSQTHCVLSKMLQQLNKQKQEDEKNQLPNPEHQVVPVTCKQLIDLYSINLQAKQKMLVQIAMSKDLASQMNTIQLKNKIVNAISQLGSQHSNQFNIPESQLPANLMNKTNSTKNKHKKISQSKKSQPSVEAHPQYFRVDFQICHKLFQHYKTLSVGVPKHGGINFEEKQHYKQSMNYHKILQIFKIAGINLQINQKLLILRSIKKFCFNQNFINNQEFIKVFKVIVHSLGFKQHIFEQHLKKKQVQKQSKVMNNILAKPRKNYRFKTDISTIESRPNAQVMKNNLNISVNDGKKYLVNDKRTNQKPSVKKINIDTAANNASYLAKAMQSQKISKVTWDSLFNMRQSSMHNFIVIPSFVRNTNLDQF